jgi:hypothetical protein
VTATVNGVPVEIEDETITFDDSRAPHVEWSATCKVPATQAQQDALDPRLRVRALVQVGTQRLDLVLTERSIQRPGNTMQLRAYSDEKILMNYGTGRDTLTFRPQHEAYNSIVTVIRHALPFAKTRDQGVRAYGWVSDPEEPLVIGPGDDALEAIWEIADRAGDRWVYNDGTEWLLTTRPELASKPKAHLTVGEDGTLITADTSLTLDDFYNACQVVYSWTTEEEVDGKTVRTDRRAEGWAEVMTGPFDIRAVGRRVQRIERNYAGTELDAQRAAQSLLRRSVAKGRTVTLEAVSDYSLRPGDTVAITLPSGPTERHLVQAVTFNRPSETMQITTRVPNDAMPKTGA